MTPRTRRGGAVAFWCAALLLSVLALSLPFGELLRGDPTAEAPHFVEEAVRDRPAVDAVLRSDLAFVAWLVARNARTLVARPLHLYDTELCFPGRRMLARGEPMLTLGLLAVPPYWLTRQPILAYNLALFGAFALSALGLVFVVASWSGSRAAGLVAGLLYAVHPVKLRDVVHPYIDDMVWTALAVVFAQRYLARGRPRDALLCAAACALQMGASFYPFVAAVALAVPVLLWLVLRYGLRRLEPRGAIAGAALLAATAVLLFGPYLALFREGGLEDRQQLLYLSLGALAPGGERFPGWFMLALAATALALPVARVLRGEVGDPRWALLAGGVFAALLPLHALGEPLAPNAVYEALSQVVPGLASVRVPERIATGVHLVLSLLAGLGAAGLLSLARGRGRATLAAVLVAFALLLVVRPAWHGLGSPIRFRAIELRPPEELLDFYRTLAERGNAGPLLEVPDQTPHVEEKIRRVGAVSHHRRRTSTCTNSYLPPERQEVEALARRPGDADALARLSALGFTTLVVHERDWLRPLRRRRLEDGLRAAADRGELRPIHETPRRSAYQILPRDG